MFLIHNANIFSPQNQSLQNTAHLTECPQRTDWKVFTALLTWKQRNQLTKK